MKAGGGEEKGEQMNVGAREGDLVRVFLQGGDSYAIEGTVTYIPKATGDSWVIVGHDGDIFNVMMFEFMQVVSRKAER